MAEILATAVVEAIADYTETSAALRRALDEYDGYSPSYHLSREIAERDAAEKRVADALEAFVVNVILSRYAVTPRTNAEVGNG